MGFLELIFSGCVKTNWKKAIIIRSFTEDPLVDFPESGLI